MTQRTEQIIALCDKKVDIKGKFSWQALSGNEQAELMSTLRSRLQSTEIDSQAKRSIAGSIYNMAREGSDLWNALEVLAQGIMVPEIELRIKKSMLKTMDNDLEALRKFISTDDDIRRYQTYKAQYYELDGKLQFELTPFGTENMLQAQNSYRTALERYRQIQDDQGVSRIERYLTQIEESLSNQMQLVAPQNLENHYLERLAKQHEIEAKIEDSQGILQKLRTDIENQKALSEKVQTLRMECDRLQQQHNSYMTVLSFLVLLPRVATAPLWAEVLKLALEQGEIDDLAIKALERLTIAYPQEALPLLTEVAARLPDSGIDIEQFKKANLQWLTLLKQAAGLKDKDPNRAAELAVEGCKAFFPPPVGSVSHD